MASQTWTVESTRPPCDIGIPWSIEENAPHWPDGTRMYQSDEKLLVNAVAEVMRAIHPAGELDDNQHFFLSRALEGAMYEGGAAGKDDDVLDHHYISLAFLVGVAWAKKNHVTGIPPTEQEPWFSGGLLSLEPDRRSAADFRSYLGIVRLNLRSDDQQTLKEEIKRVEFGGEKPSPELLNYLHWRLIEEPLRRAAG